MKPRELILYCENKTVEVVITWAERQVKDSRRSGMLQSESGISLRYLEIT